MTTSRPFLPNLEPAQWAEVTRILGEIDEFKGQWRQLGEIQAERLTSLRQVTTIESTGSSTRIEGAQLSDHEVARVLQGLDVDSFRSRDEGEVLGYAQLLQTVFDDHAAIPLTENYLKQLHKILLAHSERDAWHRGEYKRHDNHIGTHHPDGRTEIISRTASPFDTPRRMAELVAGTNDAMDARSVHPLICIARFVLEFLAIHPFQDGNGRLSRAVTALLLLRSGYEYVPYASMERVIEDNKAEYYLALRTSQTAMEQDPSRFGDWLLFFVRALQTQKRVLEAKLAVERSIIHLSDIQRRILEVVERHGRVTTPQVATALGIPDRSVRYHLVALQRQGLVEAHGDKRGRYYAPSKGAPVAATGDEQTRNGAILAAVMERGGAVTKDELAKILQELGVDPRMAGALHGRRLAHLRRDSNKERSVLTSRGRELAEQYLVARRLSRT